jgi:membrane peptidoglycan carboxypeptidase
MAQGAFSASGAGPMWRQFMTVALQHLQFPPTPFRAPQDVVLAECDGRQEVFARGVPVTRPGACRSPTGGVEPERTPTPTPIPSPTLTPTLTPTPRPSPTPTVRPTVTPTPDQDDSEGQGDGRGRGNRR